MLPTFLGIGVPKAGTTWLALNLRAHPEVYIPEMKETKFLRFDGLDARFPDEYEAYFEDATPGQAVGDITTTYFASEHVPRRVARFLPDVRLFVVLRNPIDQLYSHYWHLERQNFHQWHRKNQPESFEEALESYPDLLLKHAFYARHLERWLTHVDREQLLVLIHEELKSSPQQTLNRVFEHIGVEPGYASEKIDAGGSSARRGTSPRGPLAEWTHEVLYEILNRKLYHPLKNMIGLQSADRIKDALRVRPIMEFLFRKKGYPDMRASTRQHLRERLQDDVRKTEELIDRDLSIWEEFSQA
ncbi:hypothetical protein GGQ11_002775 [Salinibacter ruber]|uniref:sulfotransferase family protein n=1 Tax=Salinibacter ruber TaxID=146919 RepID=UPI002166E5A3|nr:sulfotransferase [Salinibacter ruber]MCS3657974.1 hypothetical protein [Salinibacter ruber]MCS4169869.1 hypothetical protein [Salinibacter ruber]